MSSLTRTKGRVAAGGRSALRRCAPSSASHHSPASQDKT